MNTQGPAVRATNSKYSFRRISVAFVALASSSEIVFCVDFRYVSLCWTAVPRNPFRVGVASCNLRTLFSLSAASSGNSEAPAMLVVTATSSGCGFRRVSNDFATVTSSPSKCAQDLYLALGWRHSAIFRSLLACPSVSHPGRFDRICDSLRQDLYPALSWRQNQELEHCPRRACTVLGSAPNSEAQDLHPALGWRQPCRCTNLVRARKSHSQEFRLMNNWEMCFKCAEDLYSALVRRQSALLGFLPWATAGIPRAMNGMHSWEMRTGFVLRRELAAFCDSATTTVAQFYVPCKACFIYT